MSYRIEMEKRAPFVRDRECPTCHGKLLPSTDANGCWIPFHYRCGNCDLCWREDGSARSCRVGAGYTNARRIPGNRHTA